MDTKTTTTCAICLEKYSHPCRLTCGHIFCYLCIKGLLITKQQQHQGLVPSSHCALCRTEISKNYLDNPDLIILNNDSNSFDSQVWFYQSRTGNNWWQYDQRTSNEIEKEYEKSQRNELPNDSFDIMIAGNVYKIDFKSETQTRIDQSKKTRRIKRDLKSIEKKGIAGIYLPPNNII
jgi:E3 ubiquitin-protein ligase RNF146